MLKPLSTTGIGSLPHLVPVDACSLILETFDIPFWPQLPKRSFLEWMIPQYIEGMPFVKMDPENRTIIISRDSSDELERFYETCKDDCRIAISEDHAKGLHIFLKIIKGRQFETLKGQVTGPLTFTLGLRDSEGRLLYFDEELREIALMLLKAKVRWQVDVLRPSAREILIFIDEPILSAIGSSTYIGVSREETLRLLREMVYAIEEMGAISGIHCCGNADWSLVIESGVKVLSFDAYSYFESLALYREQLLEFLEKKGYISWGIIPTTEAIAKEDLESLKRLFDREFKDLSRHIPEEMIKSQTILTPSCGTGSRSIDETIRIFQLLIRLKESLS
jgi:methionine synthase II (cobalamin-independent)